MGENQDFQRRLPGHGGRRCKPIAAEQRCRHPPASRAAPGCADRGRCCDDRARHGRCVGGGRAGWRRRDGWTLSPSPDHSEGSAATEKPAD